MTEKLNVQIEKFRKSIDRLQEVLGRKLDEDNIVLDASIQRFEFTFENAWKTVKMFLKSKGQDCFSPGDCIKTAFKIGLISDEEVFLDMLEFRNLTTHSYNFHLAVQIYDFVKMNSGKFEELYNGIINKTG